MRGRDYSIIYCFRRILFDLNSKEVIVRDKTFSIIDVMSAGCAELYSRLIT